MEEELRICKTCDKPKPLSCFPPQQNNKALRRFECRTCRSSKRSPEAMQRKTEKARKRWWKRQNIAITPEQYDAMMKAQDGRCGACGEKKPSLVVDHDHKTGAIRGLLCTGCNLGIGNFREDVERLRGAIKYLER